MSYSRRSSRSATALRHRITGSALLAATLLSLLLASEATAGVSGLEQKPGAEGCVSETGSRKHCADGNALYGAGATAISPDGENAYVVSQASGSLTIFDRNPATGVLTQKQATTGCISEIGTAWICLEGAGLDFAETVTVSPDGANVYVASRVSDAVAIFDRNPATGTLTQKPGTAGCISEAGTFGACADGSGLDGASTVTISPGGDSAYVASRSSDAVAIFDRNPATGELTQKPGTAGCISESGTAGECADGSALDLAIAVEVSPDGASAYVASEKSAAVSIFDRNQATGELTQKPGTAGCISESGTAGECADGSALAGAGSIDVSPDGANAYVGSEDSDAVSIFNRNPATGELTQKPGTAGCISESGTAGDCADGTALMGARSVTISPDGKSAYATALDSDAVAIFDRNPASGGLTQAAGVAGCVSEAGRGCGNGFALDSAEAVTVSPDGGNVYVAAALSHAVVTFDRGLPPDTEIIKRPKSKVRTTKAKVKVKVTFASEPGTTFRCRLDEAPYRACSSPYEVKARSKAGKGERHAISVKATDQDGLVGEPAVVKFKVIRKG